MWAKILINNIQGLEQWVNIWNSRSDCSINLSIDKLLSIFERKVEPECYIYIGNLVKIIIMCKKYYDNTTCVFFHNSDKVQKSDDFADITNKELIDESWNAHEEFLRILFAAHNRPVMWVKAEQEYLDNPKWKQEVHDKVILEYAKRGIKATSYEDYWLYELM